MQDLTQAHYQYGMTEMLRCTILTPVERQLIDQLLASADKGKLEFENLRAVMMSSMADYIIAAIGKVRSQGIGRAWPSNLSTTMFNSQTVDA